MTDAEAVRILREALIAAREELTGILDGEIKRTPGSYMSGNNRVLRKVRKALRETVALEDL